MILVKDTSRAEQSRLEQPTTEIQYHCKLQRLLSRSSQRRPCLQESFQTSKNAIIIQKWRLPYSVDHKIGLQDLLVDGFSDGNWKASIGDVTSFRCQID